VRFVNHIQTALARVFSLIGMRTEKRNFMETRARSLVKATIWTLMGLLVMSLIGFIFTGSLVTGGIMAVANSLIGLVTYLIYERVWANVAWGRNV
jgi:uncharacterized membrane protein